MSKKRVFISSTGRTGTQFFAQYLKDMIPGAVCLHEPGTPWFSKPKKMWQQIKDYGVYHLSFGQGSNRCSMYKLSRDYVAGDITKADACNNILKINGQVDALYPDAEMVVYSSGHIYGLLDLLDEVYDDARFAFFMRDPREWIGSALHKMEYSLYGPIEIFFRKISLQPSCYQNDPYLAQWKQLSKFEKYCWFYNALNCHVLERMQGKENFQVFRYEDVFLSDEKAEHFMKMLDFSTNFKVGRVESHPMPELLGKKVDSKQSRATSWKDWTPEQANIMQKHCGKLMERYGYGMEDAWKEKLDKVTV